MNGDCEVGFDCGCGFEAGMNLLGDGVQGLAS
jgi:hypothetical protein